MGDTVFEQLGQHNRFIVPPMFMLTIGDMYNFQPVTITSVTINIPDDAAWETMNEWNNIKEWSYLNGIIRAPLANGKYAQLPREVEISIACNLLEKERAIIGGSHYGHAPRKDDWENQTDKFIVGGKPYLPAITQFNSNAVVFNSMGNYNSSRTTTPTSALNFKAGTTKTPTTTGNGGVFYKGYFISTGRTGIPG
jgi:hypothetical protein